MWAGENDDVDLEAAYTFGSAIVHGLNSASRDLAVKFGLQVGSCTRWPRGVFNEWTWLKSLLNPS
jgi:hypothetical protein